MSTLLFTVGHHSPTLQCHSKLRVDPQIISDRLQLCCKSMSDVILISSLQFFFWEGVGIEIGRVVKIDGNSFSSLTCNCGRLHTTVFLCLVERGSERPVTQSSPSLRRVVYLIAYCDLALFMTNSTFNPTCSDNVSVNEYVYVCILPGTTIVTDCWGVQRSSR